MLMMRSDSFDKRRGFTLTELAIVLGVIGTILAAIWEVSSQVNENKNVQKATSQIMQILNGYRSLYSQHGVDQNGDVTCTGVTNGYFPTEMLITPCVQNTSTTYPQSPWGNFVAVYAYQSNGAVNDEISIGYYNISQAACIALANAELNSPDVISSYIGASETGPNYMVYPPYGASVIPTAVQIANLCVTGTNTNEVTIGYKAH